MAKSYNQKMKLLYLMKLFLERSDEDHVLTMADILEEMSRYGIAAERKSIYDDVEALRLFGMDIVHTKSRPSGYYLASRMFELPELKLLVDVVQSSKFITRKKSAQLIKKLESLTSRYEARQLDRQVFVANRIKTMNETIYYNVDKIHGGISQNVKITFQYFEWTVDKSTRLKKNGARYEISPWALTWDDENYYMIGYDSQAGMIKHYRVDKMLSIQLTTKPREGGEMFDHFDIASYAGKRFGMFGGEETDVEMVCENRLIGVMIDRFGKEVAVKPVDEGHFSLRTRVALSDPFYGWLSGLGTGVSIRRPEAVVQRYKKFLADLMSGYD